jgi:hypothetical protein
MANHCRSLPATNHNAPLECDSSVLMANHCRSLPATNHNSVFIPVHCTYVRNIRLHAHSLYVCNIETHTPAVSRVMPADSYFSFARDGAGDLFVH